MIDITKQIIKLDNRGNMNLDLFYNEVFSKYSKQDQISLNEFLKTSNINELKCLITYTDETGIPLYAVTFEGFQDFWLISFTSHNEAVVFCDKYSLPTKGVMNG